MTILFLHGWHSTPGGVKPTYLKDHGHEVLNPALPDGDFEEAVRIAQAEFDQHQPNVVVGSSRGGAIAMNINSGSTPLVLLCPAWKHWGTARTVKQGTIILHSKADETIPFSDSVELMQNSGLPSESLIAVGHEHRLADSESLEKMLEAVEGLETSIMPHDLLPAWIQRLLTVRTYSCSEPHYVQFRQELLRKRVVGAADAHENGHNQLRDACIRQLADSDDSLVENALSCLFVVGTVTDAPAVEVLLQHPTDSVRKAARTCLFEIRRRPGISKPS